jgi:hypothetical protein
LSPKHRLTTNYKENSVHLGSLERFTLTLCLDDKEIVKREIGKREIREKRDRKEIE